MIVDRLHTTHTASSSGDARPPTVTVNSVARAPASEEEMKEIYGRLSTTHTKSSSGGAHCRQPPEVIPPNYGSKCFPAIDGLDVRFQGPKATEEKANEIMSRLMSTQTKASQARRDNPRILLYPERTLLMNNFERIREYQTTGVVTKQKDLQARERWFF